MKALLHLLKFASSVILFLASSYYMFDFYGTGNTDSVETAGILFLLLIIINVVLKRLIINESIKQDEYIRIKTREKYKRK